MNLEIYKERLKPKYYLNLRYLDKKKILLYFCDENGLDHIQGHIAEITSDGKLYLYQNIAPDLGLQLDGFGRIKID